MISVVLARMLLAYLAVAIQPQLVHFMLFWTGVLMRTFRYSLDPTLGDTVTELQVIVLCTFCRLVPSNHGTVIQHCCVMKRFCEQAKPRRVASKVANKHAPH